MVPTVYEYQEPSRNPAARSIHAIRAVLVQTRWLHWDIDPWNVDSHERETYSNMWAKTCDRYTFIMEGDSWKDGAHVRVVSHINFMCGVVLYS